VLACVVRAFVRETRSVRLVLFGRRPLIDLYADITIAPLYHCYLGDTLIESPYHREQAHTVLYVEAFGQGRVFANGQLIKNWSGPQQIETFFIMIDMMPASTDTLLMALFGGTSDEAYSRFHVSKTYINRVLGQDFTTLGWGVQSRQQAYYLSSDITLYSDVNEFGKLIQQMFDRTSTQETILASALALTQLPYHNYVGLIASNAHIAGRRLQIRYYLSQALVHVGSHVWKQGDIVQAEVLFGRATLIDRANREPVDALMALYQQQGDNQAAANLYRRWKDAQQDMAV
jgi:two-component SAPR family response regulator